MTRADYQRYLESAEWALVRARILLRSGGRCERLVDGLRCPHQHDDTHHLTYRNVGHEKDEDLLGVCANCHAAIHGKHLHHIDDFDTVEIIDFEEGDLEIIEVEDESDLEIVELEDLEDLEAEIVDAKDLE